MSPASINSEELHVNELLLRGRRVSYRSCGDGEQDGVVLVHGIPTSSYLWRNVLEPLSAALPGWRVVAPDLPGYGGSAPGRSAGPIAQAAFCADFAAALGLERVVLAGHDFGGLAALFEALRQSGPGPPARARIVGLMLSDTTVFPTIPLIAGLSPVSVPGLADVVLAWTMRPGRRARALRRQRFLHGLRALLAPATVLSVSDQIAYAAPFADGAGWRQVRRDVRGLVRDAPALLRALSWLPSLTAPVGLVWGDTTRFSRSRRPDGCAASCLEVPRWRSLGARATSCPKTSLTRWRRRSPRSYTARRYGKICYVARIDVSKWRRFVKEQPL